MATGAGPTGLKLDALVLAAGLGSRFGGGKLLAPWAGGVLLDGALSAAFAAPVRRVFVVWGADEGVRKAAEAFSAARGAVDRLRVVRAARFAEGLSASLKAGIAALPGDCEGVFVFLGDMPRIPAPVPRDLAKALASGAQAAAPIFDGRRGHPVLFGAALLPRLLDLTGDQGAGLLLKDLAGLATVAAPDDGVLYDVDRREDLA